MLGKILIMSTILMSSYATGPYNKAKVEHPTNSKYDEAIRHLLNHCYKQINEFETKAEKTYSLAIKVGRKLLVKLYSSGILKKFKIYCSNPEGNFYRTADYKPFIVEQLTCYELFTLLESINIKNQYLFEERTLMREKIETIKSNFDSSYQSAFSIALKSDINYETMPKGEDLEILTNGITDLFKYLNEENTNLDSTFNKLDDYLKDLDSLRVDDRFSETDPIFKTIYYEILANGVTFHKTKSNIDHKPLINFDFKNRGDLSEDFAERLNQIFNTTSSSKLMLFGEAK